jgi:cytochrome c-type biogenesis protein CcmH
MSALIPAFVVLTTIAVLAVLWPVFRRQRPVQRERFELEVYRDQLAEVERDRERGLIPPEEARAARLEIERRLLRSGDRVDEAAIDPGSGRRGIVLAVAFLVPTLAATLYAAIGRPDLPDQPLAMREQSPGQSPAQPDVQQMVARLEARLAGAPGDLEGWLMLGRSRAVLGDAQGSTDAFRRALSLGPDDARGVGGLAEALTAMAGGTVTPEAKGLFVKLAEIEPRDPRAAFYLGWADFQAGQPQPALDRWRQLLADSPADAPWRPQVIEGIQAAAQQLGIDPGTVVAGVPVAPAPAPQSTTPRPSAEDMANAAAMAPEDRMAMIRGMVEKLQARMDADGTDVEGWLRLAQSRSVLGEAERAKATYEQALAQHPDEPALLKGYAKLLVGPTQGTASLPTVDDRANDLLTKAAGLQPDDPEIWWFLGVRALQEGRKGDARAAWEKVLARLDPAQPEYQDIKSRIDGLGS